MRCKLVFLTVVLLVVCVTTVAQEDSSPDSSQPASVAALVNGEVITKEALSAAVGLNQIFQVVFTQLPQNFGKVLLSTPEGTAFMDRYQREVLDQLINNRLLIQQATQQGIMVDEARVEEQIQRQLDQIMEQNQLTLEQMDETLKQQDSSLDEYKENLEKSFREQLLIQGLYEKITQNATMSDEEIAAYYEEHGDEFAGDNGTIPTLLAVQDQIRETLLLKAQAELWEAWFSEMKGAADIEILL